MPADAGKLSQKDYLKKYLSGGTDEKKKKKRLKKLKALELGAKVRVIDDDVDLSKLQPLDDSALDLYEVNEDAPQVVGIVDERPAEVQILDQYKQSQRWKVLSNPDGEFSVLQSGANKSRDNMSTQSDAEEEFSVGPRSQSKASKSKSASASSRSGKQQYDSDTSPPRKGRHSDASPPRKHRQDDSDTSPPRKGRQVDSDTSPPRKGRQVDSDASPPRKGRQDDSDASPPRKGRRNDSDASPPRQRRSDKARKSSPSRTARYDDSDTSPPRKKRQDDTDVSLPRKRRQDNSDVSPPRRRQHYDSDESPPRKRQQDDSDVSPPRKQRQNDSPPRRKHPSLPRRRNDRSPEERKVKIKIEKEDDYPSDSKMRKTLDGKAAGLQDAKKLKQELLEHKMREEKMFAKMDDTLSGRGAKAVQRDRKTGLKRDLEQEQAEQRAKDAKEDVKKEKYTRWGKGLKQTEEQQQRLQRDLYEMSKPLARYADDTDLDAHLRDQEREGDPMAEYLKSKKKDEAKSKVPIYQGAFPPNRYNIRPGYRWDGVDRSNGYEKKRFEALNAKKAVEEEAYKWSTSDM